MPNKKLFRNPLHCEDDDIGTSHAGINQNVPNSKIFETTLLNFLVMVDPR